MRATLRKLASPFFLDYRLDPDKPYNFWARSFGESALGALLGAEYIGGGAEYLCFSKDGKKVIKLPMGRLTKTSRSSLIQAEAKAAAEAELTGYVNSTQLVEVVPTEFRATKLADCFPNSPVGWLLEKLGLPDDAIIVGQQKLIEGEKITFHNVKQKASASEECKRALTEALGVFARVADEYGRVFDFGYHNSNTIFSPDTGKLHLVDCSFFGHEGGHAAWMRWVLGQMSDQVSELG